MNPWQIGHMPRPPRFDLRLLRAAVAVRDAGSVTAAAKRLGTTQPALSRLVAGLEAELGFALFTREGRRLRPAPAAAAFLDRAAAMLVGAERLGQLALAVRAGRCSVVRLAASPNLALGLLPRALARFAAAMPDVEVELRIRRRPELLRALAAGEIDFGLAVLPVGEAGLRVRPFATAEAVCLVPARHPLARARSVTPARLAESDMVVLPEGSILRRWVDDAFAAAGVVCRRRFTVDSAMMAAGLVGAGLGCAVVHPIEAPGLPPGLAARPFRPAIRFTYALLERADAGLARIADVLGAALRQSAAKE
jgi:DNA-binding transcriptional LysR family regulator